MNQYKRIGPPSVERGANLLRKEKEIGVYLQTEASPIPFRRPNDLRKEPSVTTV
jgi:hypothetical protein